MQGNNFFDDEEKVLNKKTINVKSNHVLSCDPILVPSPFAVPFKSKNSDCKKHKKEIYDLDKCTFKKNAINGIIIDKPGIYRFVDDLEFYPTVERTTAITIASSNVILDFGRFTLSQKNDVRYTYGIAIARDVSFVKITGVQNISKILDFSLVGIRVMGRTDTITIENITVTHTLPVIMTNDNIQATASLFLCSYIVFGILVGEGETSNIAMQETDRANRVTNLLLDRITVSKQPVGCQIVFTFGYQLIDSFFNDNTVMGLINGNYWLVLDENEQPVFPVCSDAIIRNIQVNRNGGDNADLIGPGDFEWWADPTTWENSACKNFTIEDSQCIGNFNNGHMFCIDHDGVTNFVWKNCVSQNNFSTENGIEPFHFSGSFNFSIGNLLGYSFPVVLNKNVTMENCSSLGNSAATNFSQGFTFAYCDGFTVKNCHAAGNISSGNRCTGFYINGNIPGGVNDGITLISCTAENNQLLNPQTSSTSTSSGLWINTTSQNIVVRDFVAQGNGNVKAGVNGGIVIFPRSTSQLASGLSNILLDNCICNGNGNTEFVGGFSGGIVIRRRSSDVPVDRVVIQNCTLTNNFGSGAGIYGDISKAVIKANEADSNSGIGFDVSTNPKPVLVTANISYDNYSGNYLGVNPAVIITGDQNNLPDSVGAKNLSLSLVQV